MLDKIQINIYVYLQNIQEVFNMLSNSKGQDLTKHCEAVAQIATSLALQNKVADEDILKSIYISAYLHDIGKVIKFFQDYMLLKGQGYPTEDRTLASYEQYGKMKGTKADMLLNYPRHHEVSWAITSAFLNSCDGNVHKNILYDILYAIYYHHPQPIDMSGKYFKTDQDILRALTTDDFTAAYTALTTSVDALCKAKGYSMSVRGLLDETNNVTEVPKLFLPEEWTLDSQNNARNLMIRFCVSSADRIISALSPTELDKFLEGERATTLYSTGFINLSHTPKAKIFDFVVPDTAKFDMVRFNIQKSVVATCLEENSINMLVKAPAGFGKSKIGLMFAMESLQRGANQVFIVAPRNTIVASITDTLVEEMQTHKVRGLSIESYYSGERQYTNMPEGSIPEFGSDIVVTNIDNLLNPSFSKKHAVQFQAMLSCPIIFDEFHEFFMDHAALLAALTIFMRVRTRICGGIKTLFLSATPIGLNILWDTDRLKTIELPNTSQHYPAVHDKPYNFSIMQDLPDNVEPNTAIMVNSIKNAQTMFVCLPNNDTQDFLMHSKFRVAKLRDTKQQIYTMFGRDSDNAKKTARVVSARLLQASLNISFKTLISTVMSAQSLIQALGRANRFAEHDSCNVHYLRLPKDHAYYSSDMAAATMGMPSNIIKAWDNYFCELITKKSALTLNDLYVAYNTFMKDNDKEIIPAIKLWYKNSVEILSTKFSLTLRKVKATPVLKNSQTGKPVVMRKPSFGLRECGGYFYVIRDQSGKWLPIEDVRSARIFEFEKIFNIADSRYHHKYKDYKSLVPELIASGYEDFSIVAASAKISKMSVVNVFKSFAQSNATPFPVFHIRYDEELGDIEC